MSTFCRRPRLRPLSHSTPAACAVLASAADLPGVPQRSGCGAVVARPLRHGAAVAVMPGHSCECCRASLQQRSCNRAPLQHHAFVE